MHTHKRACARIHTHLYRHWPGKMPTVFVAGKAKIFNYRVPGVTLIISEIWAPG